MSKKQGTIFKIISKIPIPLNRKSRRVFEKTEMERGERPRGRAWWAATYKEFGLPLLAERLGKKSNEQPYHYATKKKTVEMGVEDDSL